jgi:hypothetical protein
MKNLIAGVSTFVGLVMLCSVLSVGCKKDEPAATKTTSAGGEIGVAECDEYIAKYSLCIAKMPATTKPTAEAGFKSQVDAWKAMAATPEGKATLKTMCKPTLDNLASNPLCK